MNEIRKQAAEILALLKQLKGKRTQAQIAKVIGKDGSQLSNIKKHFLPRIINEGYESIEEMKNGLQDLKGDINNVSPEIYQEFAYFIEKMQELILLEPSKINNRFEIKKSNIWKNAISQKISSSLNRIRRNKLSGLYSFYYNHNNQIENKPFLIYENEDTNDFEVHLVVDSEYKYTGVIHSLGSDTIKISLLDFPDDIDETIDIILSISFTGNINFYRGAFIGIDNKRSPLAGRVILKKQKDNIHPEIFYNQIKEIVESAEFKKIDKQILLYLKDEIQSALRFEKLSDIGLGLKNLNIEKKWIQNRYKNFKGFDFFDSPNGKEIKDSNRGTPIDGMWYLDFIIDDRHIIEFYQFFQQDSKLRFNYQHFEELKNKDGVRGEGVGYITLEKISLAYSNIARDHFGNGVMILKIDYDRHGGTSLIGKFIDNISDKLIEKEITLFPCNLPEDSKELLRSNKGLCYTDYKEANYFLQKINPLDQIL